jgi:hypothetical protein
MSAQRGILNASRIKRRAAVNRTAGLQPVKPPRLPALPLNPSKDLAPISPEIAEVELHSMEEQFDVLLDAFGTTTRDEARRSRKRRGISDQEHKLHKLHQKLREEIPLLLYPSYVHHDYEIYTKDCKLVIEYGLDSRREFKGVKSLRGGIEIAKTFVSAELSNPSVTLMSSDIKPRLGLLEFKWTVHGEERLKFLSAGQPKVYTFISHLNVNDDCLVYRHTVTNIEIDKSAAISSRALLAIPFGVGLAGAAGRNSDEFEKLSEKDIDKL